MAWTRSQVQLRYHQTLNRICEMELLAEKLQRLADSYHREERSRVRMVRENGSMYEKRERPFSETGAALAAQAKELRSVASSWYARAKEEYRSDMRKVEHDGF